MRKVTKRLLVAGFAAMVVGACQDSVNIVQPPPPPPPPPTDVVDATVTIQGLRTIPGNLAVNPTGVAGDINVVLNIEEGDNTVTGVDLLFDGAPIGCAAISTNMAPGDGVSLSAAAGADVVECFWNTDDVVGACVGDQLTPAFANGTAVLGARITLSDGTTREANNAQTVTLINSDFIMLAAVLDRAATIGTNGRAYVGGPSTLMDGSSNAVAIAACPVSYEGTTVASLGIGGYTTLGTTNVDFGSGAATVHQDAATPFVFAISPTTNATLEDDPVGDGHFFGDTGTTFNCTGNFGTNCSGQVFDDTGLNVTSQFTYGSLFDLHMDFMGPSIAAGATIEIDGATAQTGEHYSSGTFGLSASVTDAGVGLGSGAGIVFNVNDCDNLTDGLCGTAGNTVIVADAIGIGDLAEDDELDNADTNGLDTYEVDVVKVADALENNSAQLGNIVNDPSGPMGVDTGAPVITNLLPATDPADDPIYVLNDVTVMFDAADPPLASGDVGSGVNNSGCGILCAAGGPNTSTVEVNAGALPVTEPSAGSFSADITGLADAETTLTVDVPDNAVLNGNVGMDDFTVILDTTAPDIKPFTAFESDATLSGAAAQFTLAGQVIDGDGVPNSGTGSTISALSVAIFIDTSLGLDCSTLTALTQGTGAGQVGNQARSIADTDGGEADFTMATTEDWSFSSTFLVQHPAANGAVAYCMTVDSTDTTADKTGTANSNSRTNFNRFVINWQ